MQKLSSNSIVVVVVVVIVVPSSDPSSPLLALSLPSSCSNEVSGLNAPRHFPRQPLPVQTRIFSDDDDGDGDTMADTNVFDDIETISRHIIQIDIVFVVFVVVIVIAVEDTFVPRE